MTTESVLSDVWVEPVQGKPRSEWPRLMEMTVTGDLADRVRALSGGDGGVVITEASDGVSWSGAVSCGEWSLTVTEPPVLRSLIGWLAGEA